MQDGVHVYLVDTGTERELCVLEGAWEGRGPGWGKLADGGECMGSPAGTLAAIVRWCM